jgi:hypothetical protein
LSIRAATGRISRPRPGAPTRRSTSTRDCTEFLSAPPERFRRAVSLLLEDLRENPHVIDVFDVLVKDPALPEWAQRWPGPFTITVSRVGDHGEDDDGAAG